MVSRAVARNSTKTRGYLLAHAQCAAQPRRRRPQQHQVAGEDATGQIAGWYGVFPLHQPDCWPVLRAEASDPTLGCASNSAGAHGRTVSHEAVCQFIYSLPRGELHWVMLLPRLTRRRPAGKTRRLRPIIGMVSPRDRPAAVAGRRVPDRWEVDLRIGKSPTTAAATLEERTTLFTTILAVPTRSTSPGVVDAIIEHANLLPTMMRRFITWDQGSEWAAHAASTLTTDTQLYLANPRARRA